MPSGKGAEMAFDPQREDYQRLGLRFAQTLDGTDATSATRSFASFGRRFAHDRDSLPQSDADRAFHLVAMATKLIDYQLPFADDETAKEIIASGHRLLDEALVLDPHCYDAIRMKIAAQAPTLEEFLGFLRNQADEVRAHCERQQQAQASGIDSERSRLRADLAMRPYLRWLSTQAEQALICGRNREALALALECLRIDPHDVADARFSAALAYAKLEDEAGFDNFVGQLQQHGSMRPANDAWAQLARLAMRFKALDTEGAQGWVSELIRTYPHAAEALIRQTELPVGIFARISTVPYSEDELIVAISEATILLQEGVDPMDRGTLGTWLATEVARQQPQAMLAIMSEQRQQNGRRA